MKSKKAQASRKKAPKKKTRNAKSKTSVLDSLIEIIRKTSTVIPDDVSAAIVKNAEKELAASTAEYAMDIIKQNIKLAKEKSQPLCQDTGTVLFYVDCPIGFDEHSFTKEILNAVKKSTKLGYLRQNSVDSLTGVNDGTNVGPGAPVIHFHQSKRKDVQVRLMLKGGGCENVGAQYAMPDTRLGAGRDLAGVRKVILDAVNAAQGKGCGPGVLGVCIGGDRSTGYEHAKYQLLRKMTDKNSIRELSILEEEIVNEANELGIGPMGFGGQTTLLGCKIGYLNRLPASYFVSISYMCWAYRRHGCVMEKNGKIKKWLY
jgi:fumarate hydratase class I